MWSTAGRRTCSRTRRWCAPISALDREGFDEAISNGSEAAMTGLPQIPPELRALMAEIGPRWREDVPGHVKRMMEEFTRLHAGISKAGVEVRRDIAYGSHPRQSFDIF